MKRIILSFLLLTFAVSTQVYSQDLAYGFEVGLNFANFISDSELDADGNELEDFQSNTGFHVGGGFVFKFTDNFGAKAHILFSQMGGKNIYDGPGIHFFRAEDGTVIKGIGNRKEVISITNSYIEIPLLGYAKLANKVEVFGGLNLSFLVGSIADGIFEFQGLTPNSNPIDVTVNLDYNYRGDDGFSETDISAFNDNIQLIMDGNLVVLPATAPAYYLDYAEKDGSYYNFFDLGLKGGVNFFLSQGLFVGVAVNYGLIDTSKNIYDFARASASGQTYDLRADRDTNFNILASVGFSF